MDRNLAERLAEPFDPSEVKFKAQVVRGTRALAVAYVDARVVEDRLDAVFGPGGWQDSYQVLPSNSVVCKLRVKIGEEWIEKMDVGSQSEQPDEGDRLKSAFSDSLKRAAVKLGIGRYLYRLPQVWVEYDSGTRQLKQAPPMPDWAKPKKAENQSKPNGTPTNGHANGDQNGAAKNGQANGQRNGKPEPAKYINRPQWEEIKANLTRNRMSQRKFLAHFSVEVPGQIPAESFDEVLDLSNKFREEWAAGAAPVA